VSLPRLVQSEVDKWDNTDLNAVTNAIRGFTASGVFRAPYKYLVTTDGTDTYASNAYQTVYGGPSDTGGVDGGDSAAVIQAALDNLTAARDYHQKVFVEGSFDLGTKINVPAYSILEIQGKLTKTANINMVDLNSNSTLIGGTLDGVRASYTGDGVTLVSGAYNAHVYGTKIIDQKGKGVNLVYNWMCNLENVWSQDCEGHDFYLTKANNSQIRLSECIGYSPNLTGNYDGLYVGFCDSLKVSGGSFANCGRYGVNIQGGTALTLDGVHTEDNSDTGVYITEADAGGGYVTRGVTVSGCKFYSDTNYGLYLADGDYFNISGCSGSGAGTNDFYVHSDTSAVTEGWNYWASASRNTTTWPNHSNLLLVYGDGTCDLTGGTCTATSMTMDTAASNAYEPKADQAGLIGNTSKRFVRVYMRDTHPTTTTWGANDTCLWFCGTHGKLEFWNGTAIETVTSS
jgi:hypothetical protein